MPEHLAPLDANSIYRGLPASALLAFLVIGPLVAAGLVLFLRPGRAPRRAAALVLVAMSLSAGLLFNAESSGGQPQRIQWRLLAGSSTAVNHAGIVWSAQPDLQPVHAFLIVLTMASLWMLTPANGTPQQVATLLGLLAMSLLVCVADDITSLLTGTGGLIVLVWLRLRRDDPDEADHFLRWQLGGWCGLLLGLAGLVGGLSLVRAAPHSAPSATGFLLSGDLLQIPRVCLQHPAALAVWEQWRGWALLPLLVACLLWTGCFPFHGWTRQIPAKRPLEMQSWIYCVLTKVPLLLISRLIAPVYVASPELLVLWLGVPVLIGLLLAAAEFVSAPISHDRLLTRPLMWGNLLAMWLLVQTGLTTTGVAPMIFALYGTASLLWGWGLSPLGATGERIAVWKRVGRWVAAFMFCGIPLLAWPFSSYDQALTPLRTGTLFDTLAPIGMAFAGLVFAVRLIPALAERDEQETRAHESAAMGADA